MYTDFYGLSFNPFDKQMVKEKDAFESEDFREMTARLEYLKEIRGMRSTHSHRSQGTYPTDNEKPCKHHGKPRKSDSRGT